MILVTIAFLINVFVAGTVGILLLLNHPRLTVMYGEWTPARAILSSVYLSIATVSLIALFLPDEQQILLALGLFPIQIVYKLLTPLTMKTWRHPVIISNIIICVILAIALTFILTH